MDSLRSSGQVQAMETHDDDSHRRKFENLMRQIESSHPSLRLHKKEIERQFSKLTRIPDHPPYASMIQRAIIELNELGGSSEETISKFIEAEYEDLPFAHAGQLTHHLQKLVKKGDIVCTSRNCYILTNESSEFCYMLKKEQKHLRRRSQKGRQNGRQHKVKGVKSQKQKKIEESRDKTQVNGTICKGFEEQKPAEGHIGPTREQENKGYAELIEKHNEVEEIQFKVNDEQVEAEQYNEGNEEHNQKQVQQKQQQIQVLGKTSEVLVEENNQAEDKNQAENHNGVAEEEQKELDKEVMEEQQIQVPAEGYIGPIGELENEGYAELIEEHDELEEIQFEVNEEQVEAEQYNEGNEEHNQKQEQQKQQQKEMNLQQIQVLGKTSEVLVEENNQAEDRNQAENHTGVAEAQCLKELDKEVMVELCHEEQKNEKLEEKNKIQEQESEASEKEAQLPEIQIEGVVELINPQQRLLEVTEEEKRLQTEVCCQIIDLSNMFVHFMKKEKKEHASMSGQNFATSQNVNLLGSLHLTKEEQFQLLKKTNKVREKLIDSLKLEVSENNESKPIMGGQQELLEDHVLHLNPCKGQPQEEQQLEACGKLKVSEQQPKTTSASENVPTDSMQLEQKTQIELPTHKRMPEVEITTLEELFYKQNKQIKPSEQQKSPKLTTISLDVPCDSSCSENENKQVGNKMTKTVQEDNSPTTESHRKFSGEANIFKPKAGQSYLVGFIEQYHKSKRGSPEKPPKSRPVTSSLNVLQELSLEHQHQTTFSNEAKGLEYKQPPENSIEGSLTEHKLAAVEHQFQPHWQMPSNIQLAADTSVAKQMQKQLQQRGTRRSKCEPVLMTIEADHDLTLASLKSELKQKSIPSTKRKLEPRPKTLVEITQPAEQQKNRHGQKKRLISRPTKTAVGSTNTSVPQAKDQLQQRQLRPPGQGFSQSEIKQKTREPFPLKLQHDGKEQPKSRGRGRPPKLKTNVDSNLVGSLDIGHQNLNEEQAKHRGRGRPPKSRLSSSMNASLALQ